MEKVFQTDLSPKTGNCHQACLASLLDMKLDDVPHFMVMENFHRKETEWLIKKGFVYVGAYIPDFFPNDYEFEGIEGYFIAGGPTDRGTQHSVIVDKKLNLIHDPNPNGNGLTEIECVYLIEKPKYYLTEP